MNSTTPPVRRRTLLALGALAAALNLACTGTALADARLVQVDVVDRDSGETLHVWRDHGRPVVAGRPGARYAVRLVNTSGERVLAVVAIDGVNVISGETASVSQRGYVLEPWQRTEITGWRKSNDEVAAFEFTSLSDSYAARTGRPLDVGVIGVAVFRELGRQEISQREPAPRPPMFSKAAPVPPPMPAPAPPVVAQADTSARAAAAASAESRRAGPDLARDNSAAAASGRVMAPPTERLGTGHGDRENSYVTITSFERASALPEQQVAIRYDSYANLVAAGIAPPPRVAQQTAPHAFPADPGYAPDPPRR